MEKTNDSNRDKYRQQYLKHRKQHLAYSKKYALKNKEKIKLYYKKQMTETKNMEKESLKPDFEKKTTF